MWNGKVNFSTRHGPLGLSTNSRRAYIPGASFIAATYDENLRRRKVTLVACHESAP